MLIHKFKQLLDGYDPYGFLRVSAAQSFFMVFGLFLINFSYNLPGFNTYLQLPLYGLMAIGGGLGYQLRLRNMAVFCCASISYSIILSTLQNYRILVVMAVGLVIFSLFTLSKKRYPYLLLMIAPIQAVTYTALLIPYGGNWYQLLNQVSAMLVIAALTVVIMALFPRIYFYRIWLRSIYLTINELEQKLLEFVNNQLNSQQLVFKHLLKMHDFTDALSYKEHGFAARRISLKMINIYTLLLALINRVVQIEDKYLLEISTSCNHFCLALKKNQPLLNLNFTPCNNKHVLLIRRDIEYIVKTWNRLCLKT